jgi:hypothetical protein
MDSIDDRAEQYAVRNFGRRKTSIQTREEIPMELNKKPTDNINLAKWWDEC